MVEITLSTEEGIFDKKSKSVGGFLINKFYYSLDSFIYQDFINNVNLS